MVSRRYLIYNPHHYRINGSLFTDFSKGKNVFILLIGFQEQTREYQTILFCLTFSTQVKKTVKINYSYTCEAFLYSAFQHSAVSHMLCKSCIVKRGVGTWTTVPLEKGCVQPYTIFNKCKISKIFMKFRTLKYGRGLKLNLSED